MTAKTLATEVDGLGQIRSWPGGYAMTLGYRDPIRVVRCCDGHETPEAARDHGLVRLLDIAQAVAARDIGLWTGRVTAATRRILGPQRPQPSEDDGAVA